MSAVAIMSMVLAGCGGTPEAATPVPTSLVVTSPKQGTVVNTPTIDVTGSSDPKAMVRIYVSNGDKEASGGRVFAAADGTWGGSLPLSLGVHVLTIWASINDEKKSPMIKLTVERQLSEREIRAQQAAEAKRKERLRAAADRKKKRSAAAKSTCVRVPSVVGRNHQYAQDTMQAAGFYALKEEDVTGQGRMLVWDRNWEVVTQDPSGGSCVSNDTTITLSSKKIGE